MLLNLAFEFRAFVVSYLAGGFLDSPFDFLGRTFNLVLVHVVHLLTMPLMSAVLAFSKRYSWNYRLRCMPALPPGREPPGRGLGSDGASGLPAGLPPAPTALAGDVRVSPGEA